MRTVYRLRDDLEHIAQVQRATLTTEEFGIEPTNGLFGSTEWWSQIASGLLPTHTASGTIHRLYMGSMGDWPEFELVASDRTKSQWTRYASSVDQSSLYQVGRAVEVDYVLQRFRPKAWNPNEETKVVIEVRIAGVA
jgi:hypothetical protein